MKIRAVAVEVAGLNAVEAEDAVLFLTLPTPFPSSSPSAHFWVPSLTHHGSGAVLSHFIHHIHPSPL